MTTFRQWLATHREDPTPTGAGPGTGPPFSTTPRLSAPVPDGRLTP